MPVITPLNAKMSELANSKDPDELRDKADLIWVAEGEDNPGIDDIADTIYKAGKKGLKIYSHETTDEDGIDENLYFVAKNQAELKGILSKVMDKVEEEPEDEDEDPDDLDDLDDEEDEDED